MVHWNIVMKIFHNDQISQGLWKIVGTTFQCIIVLQLRGNWPKNAYNQDLRVQLRHLYFHYLTIALIPIFMMVISLLQIGYSQESDGGLYECQVSTASGLISARVLLTVIYPEARIQGGSEYHVDAGSPVLLTCIIGRKCKTAQETRQTGLQKEKNIKCNFGFTIGNNIQQCSHMFCRFCSLQAQLHLLVSQRADGQLRHRERGGESTRIAN